MLLDPSVNHTQWWMPKQTAVRGRRSLRPGIAPVHCGLRGKQGDAECSGGQLPLENHIKNTETPGVHLLRTHGKKEDKSRHLPAPARALHHPTATPKKRNAQAAGQPPAAVAVTWASRQHAAGVVGSHGRGAAQGGEETAANGGRRGGRRHRWGADRGWATAIGGGGALRWGRQPEWRQRATGRQRSPVDDGGAADSCGAALVGGSFWR